MVCWLHLLFGCRPRVPHFPSDPVENSTLGKFETLPDPEFGNVRLRSGVLRALEACNSKRRERTNRGDKGSQIASATSELVWSKECMMEFKEYDFTPSPVVNNEVFFLESKCAFCGFSLLARSIAELLELEQLRRAECRQSNPAA